MLSYIKSVFRQVDEQTTILETQNRLSEIFEAAAINFKFMELHPLIRDVILREALHFKSPDLAVKNFLVTLEMLDTDGASNKDLEARILAFYSELIPSPRN